MGSMRRAYLCWGSASGPGVPDVGTAHSRVELVAERILGDILITNVQCHLSMSLELGTHADAVEAGVGGSRTSYTLRLRSVPQSPDRPSVVGRRRRRKPEPEV